MEEALNKIAEEMRKYNEQFAKWVDVNTRWLEQAIQQHGQLFPIELEEWQLKLAMSQRLEKMETERDERMKAKVNG